MFTLYRLISINLSQYIKRAQSTERSGLAVIREAARLRHTLFAFTEGNQRTPFDILPGGIKAAQRSEKALRDI